MKRTHSGFTLIELIIVIVILGILAVTAAPRFLNLAGDATAATVEGVEASVKSAINIVHGKARAQDKMAATASVTLPNSATLAVKHGYPAATLAAMQTALDISVAANNTSAAVSNVDWELKTIAAAGNVPARVRIFPVGSYDKAADGDDKCYVEYREAADANTPATATTNTEC